MDRGLRAFKVTAEQGSISKAAIELGMTQSALSKALRRVEEEYGAPLLMRQPRGVGLTEAGRILLRRSERASTELAYAREEIGALKPDIPKLLRIAAGPLYMVDWVRAPIKEIARRYPNLTFELTSSSSDAALAKLMKGELDAFLGYVDPASLTENLDCASIGRISVYAYGKASRRRLKSIDRHGGQDLVKMPWVNYIEGVRTNDHLRDYWLQNFGTEPNIRFVTSSMRTALELAADNDCWICLPSPLAQTAAAYGLRKIEARQPFWTFETGCVVRRSSLGYSTIREFIDVILQTVGGNERKSRRSSRLG